MSQSLRLPKKVFGLLILLLLTGVVWAEELQPESFQGLKLGQKVPNFELTDLKGKSFRLYDFLNSGNFVLINFWATWCPPCIQELPSMELLNQSFKGEAFSILAISVDEKTQDVVNFMNQIGERSLSFLVLLDPLKLVSQAQFGTQKYPESFLIGPDRVLLEKYIGERNWMDSKIVAQLKELMSKKNQ